MHLHIHGFPIFVVLVFAMALAIVSAHTSTFAAVDHSKITAKATEVALLNGKPASAQR